MDPVGTVEQFAELARKVLARPASLGRVRLVAVDGPAGSGKTTFAGRLTAALRAGGLPAGGLGTGVLGIGVLGTGVLPARAATVAEIHTDDLLQGWTDIEAFWPGLREQILEPFGRGEPARYQRYDWVRECFDDVWIDVAVPDVLVLEGVSSARRAGSALLSLAVYVHADRDRRLARGIERDGESLREPWLRWMADEDKLFAAEATARRADLLVDGEPSLPHDAEHEYVRLPAVPVVPSVPLGNR